MTRRKTWGLRPVTEQDLQQGRGVWPQDRGLGIRALGFEKRFNYRSKALIQKRLTGHPLGSRH